VPTPTKKKKDLVFRWKRNNENMIMIYRRCVVVQKLTQEVGFACRKCQHVTNFFFYVKKRSPIVKLDQQLPS